MHLYPAVTPVHEQYARRMKSLDDLRGRTFVEASSPFRSTDDNPPHCYGCARLLSRDEERAAKTGFVTSAKPPGGRSGKELFWVCPDCFLDFCRSLAFQVSQIHTWDDILRLPAMGPPIR